MTPIEPKLLAAAWEAAARRGDFVEAWRVNDLVLSCRQGMPDDPKLPYHLRFVWDGRAFDGRDVLVRCYHGLGDTLQFVRYLPALRQRAARVTLESQPELLPVLAGFPGVDRLVPFCLDAPLPASECDMEIMELPHALRLLPSAVSPPYLGVPAGLVGEARARLRARLGDGFRVGVCCRGGDWDPGRSIEPATLAAALPPGVRTVKLQRDACPGLDSVNAGEVLDDILQTASLIHAVDVVVTVDTMLAHLAGALGRPVCVLLQHRADWRWMEQRVDSPWYPSMRLFRQAAPGRWDGPIGALERHLFTIAAGR